MSAYDELYREQQTVMHGDVEIPLSHKPRLRDLAPITAAEVIAYTNLSQPQPPRPAITAYEGADIDAYWLDGEVWRHCQTGAEWVTASIDEAQGGLNAAQGYQPRAIDEAPLVCAVAEAIGVPALMAAE